MVDGWVLGPHSELLFWVPPALRPGLWWPSNTAVIGAYGTRLDLRRFAHGEDWIRCKDPLQDLPGLFDSDPLDPVPQHLSPLTPLVTKKADGGGYGRLGGWLTWLMKPQTE